MMSSIPHIVVHGGAGHDEADRDGCVRAAGAGLALLRGGADALEAALVAATMMEDDGRFNAGAGAGLGLDGETIEMSCGLMDSRGRLASLTAIERVKNPLLVARRLADTPLRGLAGDGATAFARAAGFPDHYAPTEAARRRFRAALDDLCEGEGGDFQPDWRGFDLQALWNYRRRWEDVIRRYAHGTIGAVAMDREGHFAVCTSTGGGAGPMLRGRVGDTPIVGAGFMAGEHGAVAASGIGEHIVARQLCARVYHWLEDGVPLQAALERGVALLPRSVDVGLIGATRDAAGAASNCRMPWHKAIALPA